MTKRDRRIEVALLSLNPTTKRPSWHGAPTVNGLLRGVSPELALWTPQAKAPCIRDIALHVAFWQNSVANRLSGESYRIGIKLRPQTWPYPVESLQPAEWRETIALVGETHGRLVAAVAGFPPDRLDKPPPDQTPSDRPSSSFTASPNTTSTTAGRSTCSDAWRNSPVSHDSTALPQRGRKLHSPSGCRQGG